MGRSGGHSTGGHRKALYRRVRRAQYGKVRRAQYRGFRKA